MYYVYCEATDDCAHCKTKDEAIEAAHEMLESMMLDESDSSGEVTIFEPTLVVRGKVEVSFELDTYKKVSEESKDEDADLSPAKSV